MGNVVSTREAYGRALCEFGADEKIMVFDADLTICTMSCYFAEKYPERFFNAGIAECNMAGMAAGAAASGKTAFIHTFAMFAAGRIYDQVRNSIAYPGLNVKVVGTHAGLSVGEDGATHQCIEDLSLMRTIPGMTVICPCDANETREALKAMIGYDGPCYLRLGRSGVECVTDSMDGYTFELGKGVQVKDGGDVTIIATGLMLQEALKASELLQEEGIGARVIDLHTIKPIDRDIIIKAAEETGAIVTTEEHNIIGGLGAAVSEVVGETCPVPVVKHGVEDEFGHSGTAEALMVKYGLTPQKIAAKAKEAIALKNRK
ncbi:transketolase family protein [Extibacter muris]|uniref:transketolase family protein n=1 Tax=Extibacter muris TaxID=1796622 RepID=UPI001D095D6D|nr:transketolase C-terminal domain-containing protein [Extibacter muris]MCB6202140.1 transketolase family protein [Extibacter muris]MCQ4662575.1 transketolase family protein [Extibacter muris]MCQ4693209.1 transketolase family protein [Extibacter muris]